MSHIHSLEALEIIDSRGNPTLQVFVTLKNGGQASACVPSGASTGKHEAVELRDNDKNRYLGKGVHRACKNVEGVIQQALIGKSVLEQEAIDQQLIDLDGTDNKSKLGANAILGVSLAVARAAALFENKPLFQYLSQDKELTLPVPMMNIINGGAHADNSIDFQEFMIRPVASKSFAEAVRMGCEVFHHLKMIMHKKGYSTSVGDEGGFAPNLRSDEEALDLIIEAIQQAGYQPKEQITIALDCAASEFFDSKSQKYTSKKISSFSRTSDKQIAYLEKLCQNYPIDSIEDGLDEADWEGWKLLEQTLKGIQIVGDDLFVTNPKFLQRGIDEQSANAILIKPNQIGTLSETLQTIQLAKNNHFNTVISHRSGETEDSFISDLAVATNSGQIKTGSLSRSDRTAKYNRLLRIEQLLKKRTSLTE